MTRCLFDCHAHMDLRSSNDYELMALSGVVRIVNPSTASGERRPDAEAFSRYFDRLIAVETERARRHGIELSVAVAVDADSFAEAAELSRALEVLRTFLHRHAVCAVGEIEMKAFSAAERAAFAAQAQLAQEERVPLMVKSPRSGNMTDFRRLIDVLGELFRANVIEPRRVLLLDLLPESLGLATSLGLGGYGVAVSPILDGLFVLQPKVDSRHAYEVLQQFEGEPLMFNTGLHMGFGDPMALARIWLQLRQRGVPERSLQRVFHDNAVSFFAGTR